MQGVTIDEKRAETLKRLAEESNLGITQIKAQTDALNVEAATYGMTTGEAESYRAVMNAINEAKRNGKTLTDDNIASLQREGAALGAAAQRGENLRTANDLLSGGLKDFRNSLQNGATAWQAFKQAGANALNKLSDILIDMGTKKLLANAFSGGGGNFFSLFGGGGVAPAVGHTGGMGTELLSDGRIIHPAYFENAPRCHSGKAPWGAGEMPAIIKPEEAVLTPGQLRAVAGGGQPIVINLALANDFRGADAQAVAGLNVKLDRLAQSIPEKVLQTIERARTVSPGRIR